MKLDRTTYEAWLLDRIEGNLTSTQERELDAFLAANPDLDVSGGELPVVGDEALPFDLKAELKKTFPPAGEPDASRLDDFLAARLEGDLDKSQEQALDKFLFEHPEHARSAKRMAAARVAGDNVAFSAKKSIERHFPPQGLPDKHRLTDFLIAAHEGDLTREQLDALNAHVAAHPEAQREQRLVASAHVQRERVVFFGKEQLKKKEGRVIPLWYRYAAAASIALLIGLGWWMISGRQQGEKELAKKEEVKHVLPQVPRQDQAPADANATPEHPERQVVHEDGGTEVRDGAPTDRKERSQQQAPTQKPEVAPAPEQQQVPEPIVPSPQQEPTLAHDAAPALENKEAPEEPVAQAPESLQQPAAAAQQQPQGSTIGTLLANTVRDKVLETQDRSAGLDRDDAVAMVDKGINAITGGTGGVQVQRKGLRERVKLRLGRNLAISASVGH